MNTPYLTFEEAEEIVQAASMGMYEMGYPGNRSRLAHARILVAQGAQEVQPNNSFHPTGAKCAPAGELE